MIAYFGYYDFNDEWPTLTIPEGIVSIGDYALYDMEFEGIYIYFPSTLTHIGNHALENTNFLVVEGSSVANVKTIGECAFKDASYSTGDSRDYNVEVHFHSVETIGKQAFMGSRWEKICFENAPIKGKASASHFVSLTDFFDSFLPVCGLREPHCACKANHLFDLPAP